ncbi:sugar phosphate isomerase/epimerase [Pediococcus pentosaceus]|uniref:sugar phosphate isomerase/epimerase family protein n=1 Tax=Pediococcus pentosaceus TaxID=1255 RepID=UPI002F2651DA
MVQIGFITNCLSLPLSDKIKLAANLGFNTLEVACWPVGDPKQCDINADSYDDDTLTEISNLLRHQHITISSLAYYENNLSTELQVRNMHIRHLKNVIRLAHKLDVPYVGTYIGKNSMISLEDNFVLAENIFQPILEYADALGVTILIENCPMPTWNPEGYPATITYSPELFCRLFTSFPTHRLGLNFDPSHLYWMGIDYLSVAARFADRIHSVHIKDVTTINNEPNRYGLYGKKINKNNPFDFGYYQATLPGYGDIDWLQLLHVLRNNGFTGPLQVEYKNSNGFGSIADPQRGLAISRQYLSEIQKVEALL